jgi:hypothetical protein
LGACLTETIFGYLEVLVGESELIFKRVELRVAKDLPPLSANRLIAGLGRLPAIVLFERVRRGFFELRSCRRGWLYVLRPDHASGEE